jgi:predicted house-cleaning noncanonical NTP pyrophosphatase (MazG superfamily)
MKKYNKLVRDLIPSQLEAKGLEHTTHIAGPEELQMLLSEKLLEEVNEYLSDRTPEELADILEVVYALARIHQISEEGLSEIRMAKLVVKGGFQRGLVLDECE